MCKVGLNVNSSTEQVTGVNTPALPKLSNSLIYILKNILKWLPDSKINKKTPNATVPYL